VPKCSNQADVTTDIRLFSWQEYHSMTTYEVHYQKGEEFGEALVDAEYPQQAQLKFIEQQQDPEMIVLCVIRHDIE